MKLLLALTLLAADPALEKQLSEAETELAAAQERVRTLRKKYYQLEITQITQTIDTFEKELPQIEKDPDRYRELLYQKLPTLFDHERAQLALIIDQEPDLAPAAQHQLDRILTLLTHLNNAARGAPNPQSTTTFDRSSW